MNRILKTLILLMLPLLLPAQRQVNEQPNFSSFPPERKHVTRELTELSGNQAKAHPEFGRLPDDAPCDDCLELVEKRSANSRYFVKPGSKGNHFLIQKSPGALHFKDRQGFWRDINPRLQPNDKNDGIHMASRQPVATRVNARDLSCGVQVDQQWLDFGKALSFVWMNENDTLRYAGRDVSSTTTGENGMMAQWNQAGIDLVHEVQRSGIKTSYLLRSSNSVPDEAQWFVVSTRLRLPVGHYLAEISGQEDQKMWNGKLGIFNKEGNRVAEIGAPYIYDAKEVSMPSGFGYQFMENDGEYELLLKVRASWLKEQSRSYPVTIDPLQVGADSNASIIGFEPSSFCFDPGDYCATNLTVTVPGQSTLVGASADVRMLTVNNGCGGPCDPTNAGFRIYGPCSNRYVPEDPTPGYFVPPGNTSNDTVFSDIDLDNNIECLDPSCEDHELDFELRTYSCSCPNGNPCGIECHAINTGDWTVTVEARTLEAFIFEGDSTEVCEGETVSFNSRTDYGVDPYTYLWMPDSVTSQNGNGYPVFEDSFSTLTVTDQCGNSVSDTIFYTVHPFPEIEFVSVIPSCQGSNSGEATVEINNTDGPFTYEWNTNPQQTTARATELAPGMYQVTVTSPHGCSSVDSVEITQPPNPLDISLSKTDVSCSATDDGSATVDILSGNPPYDIQWSTGGTSEQLTGLPGGTYTVTVTDDEGCLLIDSITVENAGNMEIVLNVDSITCHGDDNGTIMAEASGDDPPFSMEWNTGSTNTSITGLGPGTYTVTVTDDNDCRAERSATLSEPGPLEVELTSEPVKCEGGGKNGKAFADVTGGTPPYSYHWNTAPNQFADSATQLGAGTYSMTVTDANGCTVDDLVTVLPPSRFTISVDTEPTSCYRGSDGHATVNISGGDEPYDFKWNTGSNDTMQSVDSLSAGFYTVTITDASGCMISQNVQIKQPPEINADLIVTNVSCPGDTDGEATILPKGGTPPYTYYWETGVNDTQQSQDNLAAGDYEFYITDSNLCKDTIIVTIAAPDTVEYSVSTEHASCQGSADGAISLEFTGGRPPLVLDWQDTLPNEDSITGLEAGTYQFTITDGNGCEYVDSIVVENTVEIDLTGAAQNESCTGASDGSITVAASGGAPPYSYEWHNGMSGSGIDSLTAGDYHLTVTDDNGCLADTTIRVGADDSLLVDLGPDQSIRPGDEITLTADVIPPGNYTYQWQPADGGIDTNAPAITVSPGVITTYTLQVSSAEGCRAGDSVTISVIRSAHVALPNAFSPNGDGVNDLFFDLSHIEVVELKIFDRWGEPVYAGSTAWNGRYADGSPAPIGSYVFTGIVRYANSTEELRVKGMVLLIR